MVSAAGLGVGTVAMVMVSRKYSQMIAKHELLKEKYSDVSKSASKVQDSYPS